MVYLRDTAKLNEDLGVQPKEIGEAKWPFQLAKLEVPPIYKAHVRPRFQGISPQNMAWKMVEQCRVPPFRVPQPFPLRSLHCKVHETNGLPRDSYWQLIFKGPQAGSQSERPKNQKSHPSVGSQGSQLVPVLCSMVVVSTPSGNYILFWQKTTKPPTNKSL